MKAESRRRLRLATKMVEAVADEFAAAKTKQAWDDLMLAAALIALACAKKWYEVPK